MSSRAQIWARVSPLDDLKFEISLKSINEVVIVRPRNLKKTG